MSDFKLVATVDLNVKEDVKMKRVLVVTLVILVVFAIAVLGAMVMFNQPRIDDNKVLR